MPHSLGHTAGLRIAVHVKHAITQRELTDGKSPFICAWTRAVGSLAMAASLCLATSNVQAGQARQRTATQPHSDLTSLASPTQESAPCTSRKGCKALPVLRETGYAHVEINLTRQRMFI